MQDNAGDRGAIREASDDLSKLLFKDKGLASEYGEHYRDHLLEQYKLYIQTADRISERRQSANSFFLTVNTALIAFLGFVARPDVGSNPSVTSHPPLPWVLAVSAAGVVLCYTWYRLVRSYNGLNSGKFEVVHAIERKLPASPFEAEWEAVGKGDDPNLYLPFTHVEIRIPWVFIALYIAFAAWNVIQVAF
jgi:hypothetical protein